MKKIFLAMSLLTCGLCQEGICSSPTPTSDKFSIEGRVSYQSFITHFLKDIYGSRGNYEILGTLPLGKGIEAWIAADYFNHKGHTSTSHTPTRITLVPLTLGPRYTHNFGHFTPYVGFGFKYYFLHIHNYSTDLVASKISKSGPGVVGEFGYKYTPHKHVFVDAFLNYSYAHFNRTKPSLPNVETTSLNLQTWSIGGGIGYAF